MNWLARYRVRHYVAYSIWIAPVAGMIAAMVAVRITNWIDQTQGYVLTIDVDSMRTVLGTIASSLLSFIVFVCSALLIAVQLASAQLTPRIIAIVSQSGVIKFALTFFVFAFTFSLSALIRIHDSVPMLTCYVALYGCVGAIIVFLVMIDQLGKKLRPSGVLRTVADLGRNVITNVYPHGFSQSKSAQQSPAQIWESEPSLTVIKRRNGTLLAFDVKGLVKIAQLSHCTIELVPQVGDNIAEGEPLIRVFGGKSLPSANELRNRVALGLERTLEQDPTFAFRIIVDIASKGLSPAINDPTTAVLALDHIHHLLREVGNRDLDTGLVCDAKGQLRLVYRTPDWEDFVRLAVTEIRHFGGESIQIARRLRAMLENLIQTLPESRCKLLMEELEILKRSAERFFADPEDRIMAGESDAQGVGGKKQRK